MDIQEWIADKLEKGEYTTVDTPTKVQEILNELNPDQNNWYYKSLKDEGIETKSGYIIPYEELYTTNSSEEGTTSKTVKDLEVGDKVYYDTKNTSVGNNGIIECIVLYDTKYNETNNVNYGVQIISEDTVSANITLGSEDFDISMDSYNKALEILYSRAQDYFNSIYASSARCVGSKPDDPDWDTEEMIEANINGSKYTFKEEDENHNTDFTQMGTLGIKATKSNNYYWLASRTPVNSSDFIRGRVRMVFMRFFE